MKTTITVKKAHQPALVSTYPIKDKDGNTSTSYKSDYVLFKKHNFAVFTKSNDFKAFSYEANYHDRKFVLIKIKDATTGSFLTTYQVSIDEIATRFVHKYKDSTGVDTDVVPYEAFCEELFTYVVETISDDEEFGA